MRRRLAVTRLTADRRRVSLCRSANVCVAYADSVFINCPFDIAYQPLFHATVFAVFDCGLVSRCALEVSDGSSVRIENIARIMTGCQFGIHDLSRTTLDETSGLPRFNMPLELGMFLGMKHAGNMQQRHKRCLIVDSEPYRYQQCCSDIAGQDIKSHNNDPRLLVTHVRNWLRTALDDRGIQVPSARRMVARFTQFLDELSGLCQPLHLDAEDLTFRDFSIVAAGWLQATRDARGH
jgi:hypothetical protein